MPYQREPDCDVLIVGARVAGATLALQLGLRGHRVMLIDRSPFPSDTLSTHYMAPSAVSLLDQLGVLGDVEARGFRRVTRSRATIGSCAFEGPISPDGSYGLAPRRDILDAILVDHAVHRGHVTFQDRTRATGLVACGGRVCGPVSQPEATERWTSAPASWWVRTAGHRMWQRGRALPAIASSRPETGLLRLLSGRLAASGTRAGAVLHRQSRRLSVSHAAGSRLPRARAAAGGLPGIPGGSTRRVHDAVPDVPIHAIAARECADRGKAPRHARHPESLPGPLRARVGAHRRRGVSQGSHHWNGHRRRDQPVDPAGTGARRVSTARTGTRRSRGTTVIAMS